MGKQYGAKDTWLPVADFPEYEVSDGGFLRKTVIDKSTNQPSLKYVDPTPSTDGYVRYMLYKNDKKTGIIRRTVNALRLVLETFLPVSGMESLEANHKNLDKSDNSLKNGEWVTKSENCRNRKISKRYKRNSPIWIIWNDGTFTYFNSRRESPIPQPTLTHLLKNDTYSNESIKYRVKAVFYDDNMPDDWRHYLIMTIKESSKLEEEDSELEMLLRRLGVIDKNKR